MSWLGDVAMWSIVGAVASGTITAVYGHYQVKAARELKACKEVPPSNDAVKAAKDISGALIQRMYALGFEGFFSQGKYGLLSCFGMKDNHTLISLLRAFHAVGWEVVVRERADHDIEEDPEATEKVLTKFNPKWYVRVGN